MVLNPLVTAVISMKKEFAWHQMTLNFVFTPSYHIVRIDEHFSVFHQYAIPQLQFECFIQKMFLVLSCFEGYGINKLSGGNFVLNRHQYQLYKLLRTKFQNWSPEEAQNRNLS